jgi:hypothetical protein
MIMIYDDTTPIMSDKLRNNFLLRSAYDYGYKNNIDELEILRRFTLMLLDLKDAAFQKEIDKAMNSSFNSIFSKYDNPLGVNYESRPSTPTKEVD